MPTLNKIKLTFSMEAMLVKMSDGNIGSLTALLDVLEKVPAFIGGFLVLWFDIHKMYGPDIYVLWNDYSNRDGRRLVALISVVESGGISVERLKQLAVGRYDQMTDGEKKLIDQATENADWQT